MDYTCSKGHQQSWECHAGLPTVCLKCVEGDKSERQKEREARRVSEALEMESREVDQK